MSEHDHHPDVAIAPETELEGAFDRDHDHDQDQEHEGDGVESGHEHEHAPKKTPRFPFAHLSKAGVAKWKRETRFGVAALLSFVILVSVLLVNKGTKKGAKPPRMSLPPLADASGVSGSKSKAAPAGNQEEKVTDEKTDADNAKSKDQKKSEAKVQGEDRDSKNEPVTPPAPTEPGPEFPLTADTPPLSDTSVRDAGTESIQPPLPALVVDAANSTSNASETPAGLDSNEEKEGTKSALPVPAATAGAATSDEPEKDKPTPPAPAPAPATTAESTLMPPSESAPPNPTQAPATAGLPAPVDSPMPDANASAQAGTSPAPPQNESGPAQAETPPAQSPDLNTLAQPEAAPAPSPDPNAPAQPAGPTGLPPDTTSPAPTPGPVDAPLTQTPDPGPGLLIPGAAPTLGTGPAAPAPAPAPAAAEIAEPAPPGGGSPAVRPADEVPNFAQPPSSDDAMAAASTPPEIKPGEGIPIPNAGKGQSLDEVLPAKEASAAVAGAGASAVAAKAKAKAEEEVRDDRQDQLTPELHVVQSGENFWTISKYYYNSGRYYMALWKANSRTVSAADQLVVGQTIVIPPPEALDKSLIQPPRRASASPTRASSPIRKTSRSKLKEDDAAVKPSAEEQLILPIDNSILTRRNRSQATEEVDPPPDKRYHVSRPRYKVRAHDTLRSIARDTLNDPYRDDEIYDLNREVLNDDRRNLVEGQILELPEEARIVRGSR